MYMKTIVVTTLIPRSGDSPKKVQCQEDIPQFESLNEAIQVAKDCGVSLLDIVNTRVSMYHANYLRGSFRR